MAVSGLKSHQRPTKQEDDFSWANKSVINPCLDIRPNIHCTVLSLARDYVQIDTFVLYSCALF